MSGGDYGVFLGGLFIAIRESRVKRWLLDFEDGVFAVGVRRPYSASVVVHRFPSSGSVVQCRHSRSPVYSVVIWREISAFAHLPHLLRVQYELASWTAQSMLSIEHSFPCPPQQFLPRAGQQVLPKR